MGAPQEVNGLKLWKLYEKQVESYNLIERNKFTLLIGQGRASKTTLTVFYMMVRALQHPHTSHIIFRHTLASATDGIWAQTVKECIAHFFPVLMEADNFKINESSHTVHFPNGSRLMVRGLDTPARAGKVLSQQFATVAFDEGQTIPYYYFSLLLTRLPQPKAVPYEVKVIVTANYAAKTHWTKLFFADKLNPATGVPHNQQAGFTHFTTYDNLSIDAENYLATLQAAGERSARLMCAGHDWFQITEGALWQPTDIKRGHYAKFDELVLSFDPATTDNKNSDAHGVAICGRAGDEYEVLSCFEEKLDINAMALKVCALHKAYQCSRLVYEGNQGGTWIEALIRQHDATILCDKVNATKGKILRAEPVAALYKAGRVVHKEAFDIVEDQMVNFAGTGKSPNALDALVHGITWLEANKTAYADPNDI